MTDGENMWELVTQEKAYLRERIINGWASFTVCNAVGRVSVRDDRWNFCTSVGYKDEKGDELFDVRNDPEESKTLQVITRMLLQIGGAM